MDAIKKKLLTLRENNAGERIEANTKVLDLRRQAEALDNIVAMEEQQNADITSRITQNDNRVKELKTELAMLHDDNINEKKMIDDRKLGECFPYSFFLCVKS